MTRKQLKKLKPTNKVAAGGLAGALSTLTVFVLEALGVQLPADVTVAVTTLISFATSWLVKD